MINLSDLPPAYQAQALKKYKGLQGRSSPSQSATLTAPPQGGAKAGAAGGKANKYNARKTWRRGLCFDSQKEADFFDELRLRHRAGQIAGYLFHGKIILAEGAGQDKRALTYEPDFIILHPDGHYEIVDTKGMETRQFKDKMKILREKYPQIRIRLE